MFSVTIDKMYLVQALVFGVPGADIPPDILQQSYKFHKWITVTLMLAWCAIMAVKFSFLFFFRKLIERLRPMIIYWWVVTAFNVAILGYGIAVYYVACPYYNDPRLRTSNRHGHPQTQLLTPWLVQCSSAPGRAKILRFAIAQTVLDALGDFLSKHNQYEEGVVANSDSSFVYPSHAHLQSPDQVDSKGHPRFFSLSHGGHDLDHDY